MKKTEKSNGEESIKVFRVSEEDIGSDDLKREFAAHQNRELLESEARRMAEEDFRRAQKARRGQAAATTKAGQFIMPPGYEGWQAYRCGTKRLRNDRRNEHQVAQAEMIYRQFRQLGWADAPPGTRFITSSGIETQDEAYFVALPPHIYREWDEESEANKRAELRGKARQGVEGLRDGVEAGGRHYRVDVDESLSDKVFIPIEE